MHLTPTQSTFLLTRLTSISFLFVLCFSLTAQNGCEDDAGNFYGPYEELVVSDDPCENFTCAQTAFGFTWVINAEYLDDCSGEDDDEDGNDEEGEGGGEEECLVEFEFEQATDKAGLPLSYNVIAYVDEPDADTYYFWTFGDGMESDEPNPTHVYEEVGNYEVCLTVTQVMGNLFTCTAVYCDTLMIDMDGLVRQQLTLNVLFTGQTLNSVAEQEATLSVFPNPAADAFRIHASAGIESAVVRTMDGRWVDRWIAGGIRSMEISSAGWPTGAYVIEARTVRGVVRSRLLVQH